MDGGRLGTFVLVALAVLAAGCIGGEETPTNASEDVPTDAVEPSSDVEADAGAGAEEHGAGELGPEDTLEGPNWHVGKSFGYHLFLDPNDTEGQHYDFAVVEDQGDAWRLGTENRTLSKMGAINDFRFLGSFDKATLSTTEDGETFQWYDWPLFDGKTWTEQIEYLGESYEITYNVTYDPEIQVDQTGHTHPGFSIVGTTGEGDVYREYDYVPEVGWFAHYFEHDPRPDGHDEWQVHVMTMGHGDAHTGTVYTDEATELLTHSNNVAPPASMQPEPYASFTVSEEATHVAGFAYSWAFTGAHETVLVDPDGGTHRWSAHAAPLMFDSAFAELVTEAIPGDWHLTTVGAGQFAGGGAMLAETVETVYELEDGEVVDVSP